MYGLYYAVINWPAEPSPDTFRSLLGLNLIGTEGEDWKRHRRICSPAFNKNTYRGVWDTTAKVYEEMLHKEGWDSVERTGVVKANSITHKVSCLPFFIFSP